LLGGMAIELLAVPKAQTSTFLILLALSFVDVIGGFSLAPRTRRLALAVEPPDRSPAESSD